VRFTTPPRRLDVEALFPGIGSFARAAVRLHPRAGSPGVGESSVGGPLLWPSDEEWPTCSETHSDYALYDLAEAREWRAILAEVKAQGHGHTDGQRARMQALLREELPLSSVTVPVPMMPVAQLYARDVPDLPRPEGTDLLQVLWCPLEHEDLPYQSYVPNVRLRWRDSAAVAEPLAVFPEPHAVTEPYLVNPCAVHPEPVVDYPYPEQLSGPAKEAVRVWEEAGNRDYVFGLALHSGIKAGGWGNWSLTDHYEVDCVECGSRMDGDLLLTLKGVEWDGNDQWRPEQSRGYEHNDDVGFTIGRGYALYVYLCPDSFDHAPGIVMQ
jgi:hypothetical protein